MMKKIWAILLSMCLMISLTVPALAAPVKTSGAASTLRLESVDGTAQLKDAGGKTLKASSGTRLYNGYELTTQKSSYAYVSLDNTKAIKQDASSSSEVFQSGKKLELKVNSGQIFFDVSAPLKSDEALNIRTSTMVTGVRGTSGWVEVVGRYITRVSLLEGELTIHSVDPLTDVSRTVTIYAGQTATVVHHGEGEEFKSEIIVDGSIIDTGASGSSAGGSTSGSTSGTGSSGSTGGNTSGSSSGSTGSGSGSSSSGTGSNIIGTPEIGSDEVETIEKLIQGGVIREEHIVVDEPGLTVETLQEEDVPGFVAVEVKQDEELQQRIEENSPLSVPEIIGDAEARLETEESAAEEQEQLIEKAVDQLIAEKVDPLFEEETTEPEPESSSGSSGGGSTPAPAPTPVTYTLTINWQTEDGTELAASETQTLNKGDAYDVTDQEKVFDGYSLSQTTGDALSGTMNGNKTVTFVYASLTQIDLVDPTTAQVRDALNAGYGIINIANANATPGNLDLAEAIAASTTGSIDAGKLMNITSGTVEASANSPFTVDGTLNIEGNTVMNNDADITVNGTMNVSDTATMNNTGDIIVNSKDSLHINDTSVLNNSGEITIGGSSAGAMTVDGTVNNTGGNLYVSGIGELSVTGQITTNTTIVTNGVMTVDNGTVTGTGNYFTITNSGTLTVNGGTVSYTGQDSPNAAIYTTAGTVSVDSGTVSGTESGISTNGLSSYNGTITVNGGTVSGGSYGINSDAGGEVTVNSGAVSGDVAVYCSGTTTVTGGTLTGATGGITSGGIGMININGGTVAITGSDGTLLDGAKLVCNGGTLEAPQDVFTGGLENTVAIPQATYDAANDKYVVNLADDSSVRTFTSAEMASAYLPQTVALSYVTKINLKAGASLNEDLVLGDQTLNITGGTLNVALGIGLAAKGSVINLADGAGIDNYGNIELRDGASATIEGTLLNGATESDTATVYASLDITDSTMEVTGKGELDNLGSITLNAGGKLALNSTDTENLPGLDNQAGATLSVTGGTLTTGANSWVSNGGMIDVDSDGTVTLGGGLTNVGYADAMIYLAGTMTTEGDSVIDNQSTIETATGSTLSLGGDLNNIYDEGEDFVGTVLIRGTITSETDSTITNDSSFTIINAATADKAATAAASSVLKGNFINNAQNMDVGGTLYVGQNADGYYYGGVTFAGDLDNLGQIFVAGGSVVEATGTVENVENNEDQENSIRGFIFLRGGYDERGTFNVRGAAVSNAASIRIDDGILNVYSGTLTNETATYDEYGYILSGGEIDVGGVVGDLNVQKNGKLDNYGYLFASVPNSVHVYGNLNNYGLTELGSGGHMIVEEGGTLNNSRQNVGGVLVEGTIKLNRGTLEVVGTLNNYTAIYNGFSGEDYGYAGGTISVMGELYNSGDLINDEDGELVVGDWLYREDSDRYDFLPGDLYNSGLLDNRTYGTLYISPASVLQNHRSLYNSGTIQLGTADDTWMGNPLSTSEPAQLINGDAETGPEDNTNNFWNGYNMVGLDESLNELIEESTGTLYLYSGKLINYSTMHNAATDDNGTTGGIIIGYVTDESGSTTTSDATLVNNGVFKNYNRNFDPSLGKVRFSNTGSYEDWTGQYDAYLMVLDGNDPNATVMEYHPGTMMDVMDWTNNCIYRLLPARGADEAAIYVAQTISCDAVNATLDLNGVTVTVGESFVIDSYIDDETGALQFAGSLTLTDTSTNGKGALTSGMADATVVVRPGASLNHEAGIITNTYGDDMGVPDGNCRVRCEADEGGVIPAGEYTGSAAHNTEVSRP